MVRTPAGDAAFWRENCTASLAASGYRDDATLEPKNIHRHRAVIDRGVPKLTIEVRTPALDIAAFSQSAVMSVPREARPCSNGNYSAAKAHYIDRR